MHMYTNQNVPCHSLLYFTEISDVFKFWILFVMKKVQSMVHCTCSWYDPFKVCYLFDSRNAVAFESTGCIRNRLDIYKPAHCFPYLITVTKQHHVNLYKKVVVSCQCTFFATCKLKSHQTGPYFNRTDNWITGRFWQIRRIFKKIRFWCEFLGKLWFGLLEIHWILDEIHGTSLFPSIGSLVLGFVLNERPKMAVVPMQWRLSSDRLV